MMHYSSPTNPTNNMTQCSLAFSPTATTTSTTDATVAPDLLPTPVNAAYVSSSAIVSCAELFSATVWLLETRATMSWTFLIPTKPQSPLIETYSYGVKESRVLN